MFKDLSELISLREEKLQAEKLAAIGSVAHSVGHDIKGKIATGLNYIETLIAECDDVEEESLWAYTAIRQSLWDAAEKVQSLLLSGIPKSPKKELLSFRALIDDIAKRVRRLTEGQGIEFLLERPDRDCMLLVDRDQFRQIFNNLCSNSVLALKDKSKNSITGWAPHLKSAAAIENSKIVMSWSDNGTGIPSDIITKIFTPFYTTRTQGSGLGLHIVKEIVEKHGGTVLCESKFGHGTTFEIMLPLFQGE